MPSLRQLEYLLAVDDTKHFRRAAEKLGISQPTLSAQISSLERNLGVQLIERSRSRVMLTDIGQAVCLPARRIQRDVQEIQDITSGPKMGLGGTLKLGLTPTIAPYLLPAFIRDLHKQAPELQLYLREEKPQLLPESLASGRYDAVILPVPIKSAELFARPLFREPLFLVAPANHAFNNGREGIKREDLRDQTILILEEGHQLREQVVALAEDFGANLRSDYEGTSLDTLKEMVALEMGLSFLPGLYAEHSLPGDTSVNIVPLAGRALYRTIGLVWRKASGRDGEFNTIAESVVRAVKTRFPAYHVFT
ncbi:MAG: hydrogen peroxide-inducible genes activator [Pseudomonadota bacterium]